MEGHRWRDGRYPGDAAGAAAAGGHVGLMRRLLQLSQMVPSQWRTDVEALLCGAAEGLDLASLKPLHERFVQQVPAGQAADVGTRMLQRAVLGHTADYQHGRR